MDNSAYVKTQICRLCLAQTTIYFSLIDNENDSEMLKSLTSLQIHPNDEISTIMCYKCRLNLKLAYTIQQNMLKAEERFYTLSTIVKVESLDIFEPIIKEEPDTDVVINTPQYTCSSCHKLFYSRQKYANHKRSHKKKKKGSHMDLSKQLCTFPGKIVFNNNLTLLTAYHLFKKRQKKRLFMHPLTSERLLKGAFVTLYSDLRSDERKFLNYFRMSMRSFDELLCKVQDKIVHSDLRRASVSPTERLAIAIRYLASGDTFTDLHYSYRLGISTISGIVKEVCTAIWTSLHEECLLLPQSHEWATIANNFEKNANFPNCLGAIDEKHVRIIDSGSAFNSRKYLSIVLVAICDTNYCFKYINVATPNATFEETPFCRNLEKNTLDSPSPKPLPGTDTPVPFVFVGDEAFGSANVLKPYSRKNSTYKKKIYNCRHNRARRFIESTFGILTNKFRIFHRPLNVDTDLAIYIIKCCCLLHNFVCVRDGFSFEDTLTVYGFYDEKDNVMATNNRGRQIRDQYANYFISKVGMVEWQDSCIS